MVRSLRDHSVGILAVEYPGYGLSGEESPSEASLYETGEVALTHLREQGVSNDQIVLMGTSLGTGVAIEMAKRGFGNRLVLVSPYTSIPDVAQRIAPLLPMKWIMQDSYDSYAKAPGIVHPTLILHGADDALIPIGMGRRLAARLTSVRLVTVEGRGHNDVFVGERGDELIAEIAAFAQDGARTGR